MNLGKKLKEMRKAAGLSQKDVAQALGWTTPQLVSNNERGTSYPPPACLTKLAKMYQVDEKELRLMVFQFALKQFEKNARRKFKI